jgi:agmatinase
MQFLDLSPPHSDFESAKVAMVPVPFDATTCYKSGARDGPSHIIAASPHMEFYDEETDSEPYLKGIHTLEPLEPVLPPEKMVSTVRETVEDLLDASKLPVIIGGEHSVSIGAIQAVCKKLGKINIIQFDAHTDLRDSYLGTRFSHACVMKRVWDLGNVIQVGIRSISREEKDFLTSHGKEPVWAKDVIHDRESAIKAVISSLAPFPSYVTIDLDCLDPSIMPAVGTPEPGGLSWTDITAFLRALTKATNVVGFDVVELSPIPGHHASDFTAARLIYKFLAYIFDGTKKF